MLSKAVSGLGASLIGLLACVLHSSDTVGKLVNLKMDLILEACNFSSAGTSL